MNIGAIKRNKLKQINNGRKILSDCIEIGYITSDDILSLANRNPDFIYEKVVRNRKLNMLNQIYSCPFLLCDQKYIDNNVLNMLPAFLNYRFSMEYNELEYQYSEGYINLEEFKYEVDMLKYYYYGSSIDGKSIYKTGRVADFNRVKENVLKK